MEQSVQVFFDESGKDKNQISLMGALLIPHDFYTSEDVNKLNKQLKDKEFSLHFTKFTKENEKHFFNTLKTMMARPEYLKFNVVSFKKRKHIEGHSLESKGYVSKMIYSKIPERVLYGVLRDFGNFSNVKAKILIEECSQYKDFKLHKQVKDQLNIHSLYRHENYHVTQCGLYPKNKEIGIEFTDTLLGIMRIIIDNKSAEFFNKAPNDQSKTLLRKKKFIVRNQSFLRDFLCKINYFELNGHSVLEKRDFSAYLNLFLAKYHKEDSKRLNS